MDILKMKTIFFKKTPKRKNKKKKIFIYSKIVYLVIFAIWLFFYYYQNLFHLFNNKIITKELKNNNLWFQGNQSMFMNKTLSLINLKYTHDREVYIRNINLIFSLKDFREEHNLSITLDLINQLSQKSGKNFTFVKKIYVLSNCRFGNSMICLNNIIYYSEILGIKNLYLNANYDNWYIKNDVITDKINVSLKNISEVDCQSKEILCMHFFPLFFYPSVIKPKIRIMILRDEISRNLPNVKTNKNDLYIHIRSGDSFMNQGNLYTPAPYCFYQKILDNFKFKKIFLLSEDDRNPVIGKLISDYPKIIHKLNPVKYDIAALMNAYNMVNSASSFSQICIGLNINLKKLWEFDSVYKWCDKVLHLHSDFTKPDRKFIIYRMKPSENYLKEMYLWANEEYQRKLIIDEKCEGGFRKTTSTQVSFEF
jgi:hypothetical protein